jgi:hypothetical protein
MLTWPCEASFISFIYSLFLMHICAFFSQVAVDPSNAKEGDDSGLDDAVLHDGAPKVESFGIEDEMPSNADENQKKCWLYLNSMRDLLSDAAAVDAAAAVVAVAATPVRFAVESNQYVFIYYLLQDVWTCQVCTFENADMTSQKCSVCDSPRS